MDNEPRKATDILIALEQKIDKVLNILLTQDLTNKILSNKINNIFEMLQKGQLETPTKVPTIESVNTAPQRTLNDSSKGIAISAEGRIPLDESPIGFRRSSRPETFSGDNSYLKPAPSVNAVEPKFPVQMPKGFKPPPGREDEVTVKPPVTSSPAKQVSKKSENLMQNAIPIMQRVVNSQGNSLFLANVEIIDTSTMEQVSKTRTNGAGKWMTSLPVGNYRVLISKLEPSNKQKLESIQEIKVDGSQSPLELPVAIIK